MTVEFVILPDLYEIKREKQEEELQYNGIHITSRLWSVVNKYHEDVFIRIAGFVFKYPWRIQCDKGERARLGQMVKEIDFWYGEWFQSICIDVNSSKGISEEVSKALDV